MASLSLGSPDWGERGRAHGALEDLQEILADTLEESKLHERKELMGSRMADLMQAQTALLSSAAEAHVQNMEHAHSDRLQHFRLEMADKKCQLVSARADTDQWKRRAGVLFVKMSSVQEDADMYSMRCKLLEAEVVREAQRTRTFKSKSTTLHHTLATCQEQLRDSQLAVQDLQPQLNAALQSAKEATQQTSILRGELEDSRRTAAAHAVSAAKKLAESQAEHEGAEARAAAAGKAAEAAEKRCEELQWRLQQQDAALAQRAKLAEEARAATEGLSKEGIQAVRERASFLEQELREQLADARKFLEEERGQRRAAEASLGRQLAKAQADASALRARLATAQDMQQQDEARHALDVVSSLVQDLAPPDSAARPQRHSNAGGSSSHEAQPQHARPAPAPKTRARKAGKPAVESEILPKEVEKPRGRKKRKLAGEEAAAGAEVQLEAHISKQACDEPVKGTSQEAEEAPIAKKPRKKAKVSGNSSAVAAAEPQDVGMDAAQATAAPIVGLQRSAIEGTEEEDAPMGADTDAQADAAGDHGSAAAESAEPEAAVSETEAARQEMQAAAKSENAGGTASDDNNVVAGKGKLKAARPRRQAAPQRPQNLRASSQTNADSEDTSNARSEQTEAAEHAAKVNQQAVRKQVAKWDKTRPAGVSKLDLTSVWGHAATPLATLGEKGAAEGGVKDKENPAQGAAKAPALAGIIKPVPGRSRFNTAMEANPLAAVDIRALEAAGALRPNYVSGLTAARRLSNGGPAPAGKRKLLPAPKPLGTVGALSQDVLFGQGFKAPQLSRQ